ncbi:iron-sulfur cluster biosynthesis family protein [Cytobacillus massiliigabonensis]|uniref:iron-sulfur cluster biosynthesis family protein n=1 Tax=Cytobacillus massiliigabonensis TaxID=1871011 RepID=UPI000C8406BD|nr:iron-sulfur cluster biosynthesis family protein [Cytobacillus massiliigabonensis]
MEIIVTEEAANKIRAKKSGRNSSYLKLKYDTEGCGCVVSGVAALWLVNELEDDDNEIHTNIGSIYIEKSKEVFFEETMTIDFSEKANCFQLKSPNQYLNPRMSLYDKTTVK